MAAPVFIANTRDAQEIVVNDKSTQEVAIVSYRFPGAVPVKIVSRFRPGVKEVKIVGEHLVKNGEVL